MVTGFAFTNQYVEKFIQKFKGFGGFLWLRGLLRGTYDTNGGTKLVGVAYDAFLTIYFNFLLLTLPLIMLQSCNARERSARPGSSSANSGLWARNIGNLLDPDRGGALAMPN